MCQYESKYWFRCGIFTAPLGETHSLNLINVLWLQAAGEHSGWALDRWIPPWAIAAPIPRAGGVESPPGSLAAPQAAAEISSSVGKRCWFAPLAPCPRGCWLSEPQGAARDMNAKGIQQGHFLSWRRKSHSYVEVILKKSDSAQGEVCLCVPR